MRKTINIRALIDYANSFLDQPFHPEYCTKHHKMAVCTMIEQALFETGNYRGFAFKNNQDSELSTFGYYSRSYFIADKLRKGN
tara:strand:- start:214 stop:462 length:249 start_codon:yes stop_codon:yes gene_type:complete